MEAIQAGLTFILLTTIVAIGSSIAYSKYFFSKPRTENEYYIVITVVLSILGVYISHMTLFIAQMVPAIDVGSPVQH